MQTYIIDYAWQGTFCLWKELSTHAILFYTESKWSNMCTNHTAHLTQFNTLKILLQLFYDRQFILMLCRCDQLLHSILQEHNQKPLGVVFGPYMWRRYIWDGIQISRTPWTEHLSIASAELIMGYWGSAKDEPGVSSNLAFIWVFETCWPVL